MPGGYVTTDLIDFNEIYYGSVIPAVDTYRKVELPVLSNLFMPHDETLMKYFISEKNGYQRLSQGERPHRKNLTEAVVLPRVGKWGYGFGSDLDTLRRSDSKYIMNAIDRGFAEDSEHLVQEMLKVVMVEPGTGNAGYGWYNGEFAQEEKLTAPPRYQNNTFNANHTHYLATNNATLDITDITALKQTIRHHGHKGTLVALINSVQAQEIEDLASWNQNTIIRSPISDQIAVMGFTDRFQMVGVDFLVTEMMPSGYILMMEATPEEGRRPMILFEPKNMAGLNLMPGVMNDYPLIEAYFERWFGLKVWQRGGGAVLQIVASTTYTSPSLT
jgi:hypothetical protein